MVFVVRSRSKYGNEKVTVDGFTFDSKREADRYEELRMKQKAGLIEKLELQKRYALNVYDWHICDYIADFVYREKIEEGRTRLVVEDAKGKRTRDYIIKRKLMRACHGIEIRET